MPHATAARPSNENRLLASLPLAHYRQLLPRMELVQLPFKQVLNQPGQPLAHAYFPRSGVVSLVATMRDKNEIEVASIGREGMVGLRVIWGDLTTPHQLIVQVPGEAWKMSAADLEAAAERFDSLAHILRRYAVAFLKQITQSVACNGLHSVKQRCCRWLLMTRDRVDSDQFPLTQEFLAKMLGVRRAGVAEVARMLQKAGYIDYTRGTITIRNRKGLEAAACECYQAIRQEWDRLG